MPTRTLTALAAALASRRLTAVELLEATLARLQSAEFPRGAITHLAAEEARQAAIDSDARRAAGRRPAGALDGLPVLLKANMAVRGWPLTAGLAFRRDERAERDSFLAERLRRAGAVLLGLTNMDEGALGADGINPWYGTIDNPIRPGHSAGGSSGGAAAAVAAAGCALALGTDTIGSVRIPGSFCGTVGFKPSYGVLSVGGIVPVHLRFDHAGLLTRSVADATLAFGELAAHDPWCRVSIARELAPPPPAGAPQRIGYAVGLDAFQPAAPVIDGYNRAIAALGLAGHALRPLDLQRWDVPRVRRAILALCEREMWRVHRERIAAHPGDFSDGLRAFIRYGGKLTDEDLHAAELRLATFCTEWHAATADLDAVLLPTTACVAFPHRQRPPQNTADLTAIASATGQPSISIPVPRAAGGAPDELPVGVQLIAPLAADHRLLALAADLERQLAGTAAA